MKKRKDGRYAKQVTVGIKDGKPVKKTVYGKTIKEVEKNYRDMMLLVDKGVLLDSDNITVAELWDEWFRIKKSNVLKEQSKSVYATYQRNIMAVIGEMKIKKITRFTIESFLEPYITSGRTATAKQLLVALKSMFNYAVDNDIVFKNPCNDIIVKHVSDERRALTEFEKMLIVKSNLPSKEKAFVSILRYTGMRRGEVIALQKKDIDLEHKLIHIYKIITNIDSRATLKEETKTKAGKRVVPIFKPLYPIIKDYISNLGDEDMLFLNRNGNLMNHQNVDIMVKKIRKIVGLSDEITCHTFRHNFISECYAAGIDVLRLQQWVGHADINTTLGTYTHLEKEVIESGEDMNYFYSNERKSNGSQNIKEKLKAL